MTTLICVLKVGGDFQALHVTRLFAQWATHAPSWCDFMCLTDDADLLEQMPDNTRALEHGWPGFFAKMEAYRVAGPAILMDLDVNVVGDLTPLCEAAERHELLVCRDFASPDKHPMNSSIVGWRGNVSRLCRALVVEPELMSRYDDPGRWGEKARGWGDQALVAHLWGKPLVFWQDVLGQGSVVSFKANVRGSGYDRDKAVVVCSHGLPRPWSKGGADSVLGSGALR